jgi:hypothetical protein
MVNQPVIRARAARPPLAPSKGISRARSGQPPLGGEFTRTLSPASFTC